MPRARGTTRGRKARKPAGPAATPAGPAEPTRPGWNARKEEAAILIAADEHTDEQIAAKVGMSRSGLFRWKQDPAFQARVRGLAEELRESVKHQGIAVLTNRIRTLDKLTEKMLAVFEARGADPTMKEVPGGPTGLLVREIKFDKATGQKIETYAVDTGTVAEIRACQKQAAQELGQWAERKGPEAPAKAYVGFDPEEV